MIDEVTIRKAVELLRQAAPGSTVIVFGSCARGDAKEDSDLDVMVVEPKVTDRHKEILRLSRVLRPLAIPVDVLVYDRTTFDYWADTPDEILGFHTQQAEEKLLKAALTSRAIRYGRTHDLTELLNCFISTSSPCPGNSNGSSN